MAITKPSLKGRFTKCIAVDCETSGINFNDLNPAKDYQIVSLGMVVADAKTFLPIDELYVTIKWNGEAIWSDEAEKIHGLSKEFLQTTALSEEDAVVEIAEFILKHFSIKESLVLLGHNVATFDLWFIKTLLLKYELPFKFAHRQLDTFSLSMATVRAFNSDDLFYKMGLPDRKLHNALEDAKYALSTYRRISKIWKKAMING